MKNEVQHGSKVALQTTGAIVSADFKISLCLPLREV